jgi:hypothetical protein
MSGMEIKMIVMSIVDSMTPAVVLVSAIHL